MKNQVQAVVVRKQVVVAKQGDKEMRKKAKAARCMFE